MSNCADEELFRYVGTSSLKRRQFVERRTHLFRLTPEDNIALQVRIYFAISETKEETRCFRFSPEIATNLAFLHDHGFLT